MTRLVMESVNCSLIPIAGLIENQPMACNVLINNQDAAVIVVRIKGNVFVYLNQCPHQGRRLDYAPGKFLYKNGALICAAHGASFEMSSGLCQQGPCRGESLQLLGSDVLPDKQSIRVYLKEN